MYFSNKQKTHTGERRRSIYYKKWKYKYEICKCVGNFCIKQTIVSPRLSFLLIFVVEFQFHHLEFVDESNTIESKLIKMNDHWLYFSLCWGCVILVLVLCQLHIQIRFATNWFNLMCGWLWDNISFKFVLNWMCWLGIE